MPAGTGRGLFPGTAQGRAGKLIWAGRAWATGGLFVDDAQSEPEAVADARRFGASEAQLAALTRKLTGREAEDGLWPQHVHAATAFCVIADQWRIGVEVRGGQSRTVWHSLDYGGAKALLDGMEFEMSASDWSAMATIAMGARNALNGGRP
ncbi:Phage related hypothetical protein [Devosia enhydra]|uniref:Uncharacterized protein n=1 Tax=Devosia enhydra TaxID=665118 RepID=A0A1K2I0T5_9HYPH|nr:DUF1799 domain-containing protein [Devosia enhydra]SFZ86005.1 Phage related hypothetical protein [Devosia enhydra]